MTCDDATIKANAAKCAKDRPNKLYARVDVAINAVNAAANTIDFRALGADGLAHSFTGLPWGDKEMWNVCPATLAPADGHLPKIDTTGVLYLSDTTVSTLKLYDIPKWPRSLASFDPVAPIVVDATSLVLTGVTMADGSATEVVIDLLDPALAAVDQTIAIDGTRRMTVILKPDGFDALTLTFPMRIGHLQDAVETILERKHPKEIRRAWAIVEKFSEEKLQPNISEGVVRELLEKVLKA